jgi:putative transposase
MGSPGYDSVLPKATDNLAYEHGVTIDFSKHSKPMENVLAESLNGPFRDECMNAD